jgi:hypothetical protein
MPRLFRPNACGFIVQEAGCDDDEVNLAESVSGSRDSRFNEKVDLVRRALAIRVAGSVRRMPLPNGDPRNGGIGRQLRHKRGTNAATATHNQSMHDYDLRPISCVLYATRATVDEAAVKVSHALQTSNCRSGIEPRVDNHRKPYNRTRPMQWTNADSAYISTS